MKRGIVDRIENFIEDIKREYKDLIIDFDYDLEENFYSIWQNDNRLQNESEEFTNIVGNLLRNEIYDQGISNISFGYDYYKSMELMDGGDKYKCIRL